MYAGSAAAAVAAGAAAAAMVYVGAIGSSFVS